MRTQEWRATNAPTGPGLWIRCGKCNTKALRLRPGTRVAAGKEGSARSKPCPKCAEVVRVRVSTDE